MSRHYFLQGLADAYYTHRRNPTPNNEMKALKAFLAGMAACIKRKELEAVCITVDELTNGKGSNLQKVNL